MAILKLKIPGIKVEYEGAEKLPENRALQLLEAMKKSHNEDVKKDLLELNENLEQNLAALDGHIASISKLSKELARRIKEVNEKSIKFFEKIENFWQTARMALQICWPPPKKCRRRKCLSTCSISSFRARCRTKTAPTLPCRTS